MRTNIITDSLTDETDTCQEKPFPLFTPRLLPLRDILFSFSSPNKLHLPNKTRSRQNAKQKTLARHCAAAQGKKNPLPS
jgi:hypothetical protein